TSDRRRAAFGAGQRLAFALASAEQTGAALAGNADARQPDRPAAAVDLAASWFGLKAAAGARATRQPFRPLESPLQPFPSGDQGGGHGGREEDRDGPPAPF